MPSSMTSGSSIVVFRPEHRRRHWPSSWTKELGTPNSPAIRFTRGQVFAATLVRNCYGLSGCWPPCTDLTGLPVNGGFYFQAFDGSVTLPVAGYNYNSVWTPLLAGLPPAGMAASLAALAPPCGTRRTSKINESEMRHSRSPKRSRPAQPRAEDPALASDYPSSTEERNKRAFQDYYFASCLD